MEDDIYRIYTECFKEFPISYEDFLNKTAFEESEVIWYEENGSAVGFSLILHNTILLLCIKPDAQRKGFGSRLLMVSEQKIKENGYQSVLLGYGNSYLFPGVPQTNHSSSYPFFQKHGYTASRVSADLLYHLNEFDIDQAPLGSVQDTIRFQYYEKSQRAALLDAVKKVEENWLQYYTDVESSVLIAAEQDKVLGFAILSDHVGGFQFPGYHKTGSIGCVGVVPEARKQGIGLWLVAYGLNDLKISKCDSVYIGYTYYENWYKKLGAYTTAWYHMCEKDLNDSI